MKKFLVVLMAVLVGCRLAAADVVPEPFPPASFTFLHIELTGKGTTTSVDLDNDAVVYAVTSADGKLLEKSTAHPSGDDWFQFIQKLNEAKVYKWARKYYYPGQGEEWAILLQIDNQQFASEGDNEYPKTGSESDPASDPKGGETLPFQLFWQATLVLAGKAKVSSP
jgi:hypothetical protein